MRKVERVHLYFAAQFGAGAGLIDSTIDCKKHKVEMILVPGGIIIKNLNQDWETFVSTANIKYAKLKSELTEDQKPAAPMEQKLQMTAQQVADIQASADAMAKKLAETAPPQKQVSNNPNQRFVNKSIGKSKDEMS